MFKGIRDTFGKNFTFREVRNFDLCANDFYTF